MEDDNKTVIITTLNDAWAEPNSIFELFVESFRIGNDTERLLKHLVVVCLDDKAFGRCLTSLPHGHCFQLRTKSGNNFTSEAFFMSSGYLDMMWTRIHFLSSVLQMGYSFVFTVRIIFYHLYNHYLLLLYTYICSIYVSLYVSLCIYIYRFLAWVKDFELYSLYSFWD